MMQHMRYLLLVVALIASACGKDSPTSPSPNPTPTVTPPITLGLHVTATNGGQPLAGLSVTAGTIQITTDSAGAAMYQAPPVASVLLSLEGAGIVPRILRVAANTSRDLTVDAISVAGFDLNFYRELIRNGLEEPATLQPLRRWTRNPSIYLQTGADARTLDDVERITREAVPQWTAGKLTVATVERGTGTMEGQPGWITIKFAPDNTGHCGTSLVGQDGGYVQFEPKTPGCSCPGVSIIRARTIRHEIGHAMGFWHTDNQADVMFRSSAACDLLPSARERQAAAIAYSRPIGNQDPDSDPAGAVSLSPMRVQ